jgi:hypothetical protein
LLGPLAKIFGLQGSAAAPAKAFAGIGRDFTNDAAMSMREGIAQAASALQINPVDLATVISYETGGTFNPMQLGPTTQWGQHQGLLQFGQPQAAMYGADFSSMQAAMNSQLGADGAIVQYLRDNGVTPGMGLMDIYSTVNAGAPGLYGASDAFNGGAAGSVADKVNFQMEGHLDNAQQLFADFNGDLAGIVDSNQQLAEQFSKSTITTSTLPPPAQAQQVVGAAGGPLPGGNGLQQSFDVLSKQLTQVMQSLVTNMTQTFNQFGTNLANSLNAVVNAIRGMAAQIQAGSPAAFSVINLGSGQGAPTGGGAGGLSGLFGMLGGLRFADGGQIPIHVSNGETYLDRETTESMLPLLEAMNANRNGKIIGKGTGRSDSLTMLADRGGFVLNAKASRDFAPIINSILRDEPLPAFADGGYIGSNRLQATDAYVGSSGVMQSTSRDYSGSRPVVINATYHINGGDSDAFRKSATQHARDLQRLMSSAGRNS